MGIFTVLLVCLICYRSQAHMTKISPSVIPHADLTLHAQRRLMSKIGDLHASNTITPFYLQPPTMAVASGGNDQHFQWWDNTPELVQSRWYGFNRFTSRAARNLGKASNRKARASYLLGESSQVQPLMSYKSHSQSKKQYDEDLAIHEVLRELQRHIRPLPQRGQPRIIMIDEAFGLPPGVLVPVNRAPRHVNTPRQSNYHSPKGDYKRLASAPMPVTIQVVPLKLSSIDIANALKSMSFVPIPLDFVKANDKSDEGNVQITFDDKTSSDDEEELPPPSSHVATPLDNHPLGITYAEAQRTDHFINYQPRK